MDQSETRKEIKVRTTELFFIICRQNENDRIQASHDTLESFVSEADFRELNDGVE